LALRVLERRVTTKDFLRRRVMPVVFGVVIVLMSRESCHKAARTHATFVLSYGAAEPLVKTIDAELWMNQEQVATFHRTALDAHIGMSQFEGSFPATDGELRLDIELRSGQHRNFVRTVHADENAVVTVNLEYDLQKP
jgi:hypothetical protein